MAPESPAGSSGAIPHASRNSRLSELEEERILNDVVNKTKHGDNSNSNELHYNML